MRRYELDARYRAGKIPAELDGAMHLAQAVAVVETFPPVGSITAAPDANGGAGPAPRGYGLLPPRGVPPLVRVRGKLRDPYGKVIPPGTQGQVGALWNDGGQAVIRLWFRWGEQAEHGWKRGPVDIRTSQIQSVSGLGGELPQLTGWQLVRLDDGSAESEATKRPR
jgi:hypothetical protein